MLALENLGRRIGDERPFLKFARNPTYADDVKWLMGVAQRHGMAIFPRDKLQKNLDVKLKDFFLNI
jgi:hypothetical protein